MKPQAAIGIVFNEDRTSVLLVRRRDIPVWVPPGGGIDPDETPEDAVLRELKEETGFETKIARKVGRYTPQNKLSGLTHVFECEILSGKPITSSETAKVAYFSLDKLPRPMAPPHVEWIQDAAERHPYIIERPIKSVSYATLLKALFLHPNITLRFLLTKVGIHLNDPN